MRVAFGYDVRVPQESGWLQKVRTRDFADVELAEAVVDPDPVFEAVVPVVGEWGIADGVAALERHSYFRSGGRLCTGLAVSRPPRRELPADAYARAAVAAAPGAPALVDFEDQACDRDWRRAYPFAWRPFEPSPTRRRAAVHLRKSAKGALRDEAWRAARERGLAECRAESARYFVRRGRVFRYSGEPVWAASCDLPARVVATCDHAAAATAPDALLFPADRLADAISACAALTGRTAREVAVVGDIRIVAGAPVRFRSEAFEAVRGLHAFVEASHHLLAGADAAAARAWLSIREATADHPDPKSCDVFLDRDFAARIGEAVLDAKAFVAAVRRGGLVDDSRAQKAGAALARTRARLDLLPSGPTFPATAEPFSAADEAAIEALA